jgi:hypothetical protein
VVVVTMVAALTVSVSVAGCGRGEFADRSAVVDVGGSRQTYQVDSCGLDGSTIYLVARAPDGAVLQAVVGLEEDLATGIVASTGVSVDADPQRTDTRVAAFGAEAWDRRGPTGAPPGTVSSARLRGSRIQISAQAVAVDALDRPVAGAEPTALRVDARCDEQDEPDGEIGDGPDGEGDGDGS